MKNNTENSAFPQSRLDRSGLQLMVENFGGLTKREYFIAQAVQGLCANPNYQSAHDIGLIAVKITDDAFNAMGYE